ncbi:GGDEF domain-containing phosphodiesterase [Croceibacterium aestuarii]|uniref:GGDEF domain-containing phosphodiesterase n=1 Tax=Croceibacterium aestuarii TaxID=3064139 RepID=UPI00272DEE44|nr:GGDEF domain-containing phosphodiesterase [Croceibacterium sp. D39]
MATYLASVCLLLAVISAASLWSWRKSRIALSRIERQTCELEAAARHCPLTGLANRAAVCEWLVAALDEPRCRPAVISLDFCPLAPDGESETKLVRRVSQIAAHIVPEDWLLARLAAGRYVVVLGGSLETGDLVTLARSACSLLGTLVADSQQLRVGVSIARTSDTPDSLIDRALVAQARHAGGNAVGLTFSDPELVGEIEQRAAVVHELKSAIAAGRIEPFFQPLVELGSGRILGFEVLARWRDVEGRLRMPGDFLPLAEESGLVGPMYASLLAAAAAHARQWPSGWNFALNLSACQLAEEGLVQRTLRTLDDAGVGPNRLELEISERALCADPERARKLVDELRAHGVGVTLDNFGSGSLRLRDLARFSFNRIKLDPANSAGGEGGHPGVEIGVIVAAARHLGVPVLAQRIETYAGAAAARVQGCAIGQGYLFGRPDRKTDCFRLDGALARPMDFAA